MFFLQKSLIGLLIASVCSASIAGAVNSHNQNISANPTTPQFHQLYVLGDSLSDGGALMGVATQFLSRNTEFPVQKMEFEKAYYNHNQFCTGKVAVQHVAEDLNLSINAGWHLEIPKTFSDEFGGVYDQFGNDYAVGGSQAGAGPGISNVVLNSFTLEKQFEALMTQHGVTKNGTDKKVLDSNDLVIVEAGNNDLFNALSLPNNDSINYTNDQKAVADNAVTAESHIIDNLVDAGVNHIVVSNVANLWETPSYLHDKHQITEHLTKYYDAQWDKMFTAAQTKYGDKIKKFDLSQEFTKDLTKAQSLGMDTTHQTVISDFSVNGIMDGIYNNGGDIRVSFAPGKSEADFDKDLFLDKVHPTEWMQNQVGESMFQLIKEWSK